MKPLALVLVALLPACTAQELACGPGTMKVGGYCVPEGDTDASSSSGASNVSAADDDDGESNDTESGGSGGTTSVDEAPYAACFAGSDAECRSAEDCTPSLDTCAGSCSQDTDCPNPLDGTAVQRCEWVDEIIDYACLLYCGVAGSTCPTGMTCISAQLCADSGESSSGYGYGGGCEFSTLEVCVWM